MPARVESFLIPRVCAWCKIDLPPAVGVPMLDSDGKPLTSHGCCDRCVAKLEAEMVA